jgi:hypothetical protein
VRLTDRERLRAQDIARKMIGAAVEHARLRGASVVKAYYDREYKNHVVTIFLFISLSPSL